MKRETNLISDEQGSGLLGLIALICLVALYIKKLYPVLLIQNHLIADVLLGILLTAVLFFFFGTLSIWAKGGKSNGRVSREVRKSMKHLGKLIDETQAQLVVYENRLPTHRLVVGAHGLDCISKIRKILGSMKERFADASELISYNNHIARIEAYEILDSNLNACRDCFNSLIVSGSDELDIPVYDLESTIQDLFAEVENDSREIEPDVLPEQMVA